MKAGHLLQEALPDQPFCCLAGFVSLCGPPRTLGAERPHPSVMSPWADRLGRVFRTGWPLLTPAFSFPGRGARGERRTTGPARWSPFLSQDSFLKAQQWLKDLEEEFRLGDVVVMLVGNRLDLGKEREVAFEVGLEPFWGPRWGRANTHAHSPLPPLPCVPL